MDHNLINTDKYIQKVYAGILGKIIGVYLGRPIENWNFKKINQRFNVIDRYINDDLDLPLVVTDDDITGTLTFIRACQDFNFPRTLTSEQIGETWLNYIIYGRSIFWWGGLGNSTEHTAYLRLLSGIKAPGSGSEKLNGKVTSEQIGSQIFIDGWPMIAPGDPDQVAHFAKVAAQVSHDGEAVNAAVLLAVMESLAFIENDLNKILDQSIKYIPHESIIYCLINDLREWREKFSDWQKTRKMIESHYGYDKFKGVVHIIPNHALIHLGLLYGNDDFLQSLMITNSSGWDTDCNSGNVGCFLGIKNGIDCIEQYPQLRKPVNDRLFLPTADGGSSISDALTETYKVVNINRQQNALDPIHPKNGARFHFSLPGSIQGFFHKSNQSTLNTVEFSNKFLSLNKTRGLNLAYTIHDQNPIDIVTPTFISPSEVNMKGYVLDACPTLYPGQELKMSVCSGSNENVLIYPIINYYGDNDSLVKVMGELTLLTKDVQKEITWKISSDIDGPIASTGFSIHPDSPKSGILFLDYLTWGGTPEVCFKKPNHNGKMWERAWIKDVDIFDTNWEESFRIIQNTGTGLLIQGTNDWKNLIIKTDLTPRLLKSGGIAFRIQGRKRYYALLFSYPNKVILLRNFYQKKILFEGNFQWTYEETYNIIISLNDTQIKVTINGSEIIDLTDNDNCLSSGAIGFICEEGCLLSNQLKILPIE